MRLEVVAFLRLAGGQRSLFQLAQVLDAVALEVGLGINGRIAQLGARLDVERGTAGGTCSAGAAELLGQVGVVALVDLLLATVRLYQMASLAISSMHSRNAYLRSVETSKACLWELSSRLSSRATPPSAGSTDWLPASAARARSSLSSRGPNRSGSLKLSSALRPHLLRSISSHSSCVHQQHPARRVVVGEQAAAGVSSHAVGLAAFAVAVGRLRLELQRPQFLVIHAGDGGGDHQQQLVPSITGGQHRQLAVGQGKVFRRQLVADGLQQRLHQIDKQAGTLTGLALGEEALAGAEVAVGTGGRAQAGDWAVGALLLPLVEQRLEVFSRISSR